MACKGVFTVREAAEYLGYSEDKVYKLLRSGELKASRPSGQNGNYRIRKQNCDDMLTEKELERYREIEWKKEEEERLRRKIEKAASRNQAARFDDKSSEEVTAKSKKGGSQMSARITYHESRGEGFCLRERKKNSGRTSYYVVRTWIKGCGREQVLKEATTREEARNRIDEMAEAKKLVKKGKAKKEATYRQFMKAVYIPLVLKEKDCHDNWLYPIDSHLIPFFGDMKLEEIDALAVRKYVMEQREKRTVKNCTINMEMAILRSTLGWGKYYKFKIDEEVLDEGFKNGIRGNLLKDDTCEGARALGIEENEKLEQTPREPHIWTSYMLGRYAGLRVGEVLSLEWLSVDLEKRLIWIEKEKSKNDKKQSVPICEKLYVFLVDLKSRNGDHSHVVLYNDPVQGLRPVKDIKFSFSKWLRNAGIENVTFHSLRKTFATRLLENDVDLKTVSVLLRHSDISVTDRYLKPQPKRIHESVNRC